jgi:NAD(P)-dependent dehydrogenase (short-subunit alcohol dehydrogenase family)
MTGKRPAATAAMLSNARPAMTADEVLAGTDLSGHVSVVTGASGGLGFETARALAAHGARVVLASRDPAKNMAAADRIRRETGRSDAADEVVLELADLASVRAAADLIGRRWPVLHSVVGNAGVMAVPQGTTADGFETHFGVNHLGHFVFVNRLMPSLVAGAPSRVVVLSSVGHRWADIDLEDPNLLSGRYRKFRAYGASKTANVLFAVGLDARHRAQGVRAFAVHPGGIQTELGRYMSDADREKLHAGAAAASGTAGVWKTVRQGAATSVWAAVSPELDDLGGLYLEDCSIAEVEPAEAYRGVASFATDPGRAAALWTLSERLAGDSARG